MTSLAPLFTLSSVAKTVTDADLLKLLAEKVASAGSMRAWSRQNGMSVTFVSLVLSGQCRMSAKMAEKLGYCRPSCWVKIKQKS